MTANTWFFSLRELDFIKRQEAERKKIEDLEKAHLAEVQGLQARVSNIYSHIWRMRQFYLILWEKTVSNRCVCVVGNTVLHFFQIRDLEAEVFRLMKQNGSQVNNNNNIFERQTSFGEVSRGDPVENLDTKQVSCLDGLSQGLFEPNHNS